MLFAFLLLKLGKVGKIQKFVSSYFINFDQLLNNVTLSFTIIFL